MSKQVKDPPLPNTPICHVSTSTCVSQLPLAGDIKTSAKIKSTLFITHIAVIKM